MADAADEQDSQTPAPDKVQTNPKKKIAKQVPKKKQAKSGVQHGK
jgi:hypothetical protein